MLNWKFIFPTFPNVISYGERKHIKQQKILKQLLQEAAAVPYLHTAIDTISTFTNNISVLTSNENSFKRDTSNVKTSQCEILHKGPTSAFVFLFPKGRTHRKQMERLSKTTENCQIHSQLIQYISIYILFHLFSLVLHVRIDATTNPDRTNCWADRGCEATHSFCLCHRTAVGGQGGLPYLLNFTFSIRYFLRVHKGVEYPLQKNQKGCIRDILSQKSH